MVETVVKDMQKDGFLTRLSWRIKVSTREKGLGRKNGMKHLKLIVGIVLIVIISFPTFGVAAHSGKMPIIERGVFVDHAIGHHSPPPGDDTKDDYRIRQGVTWSRTGVPHYDANNMLRYTSWPINYTVYTSDISRFNKVEQAFETWDSEIGPNMFWVPTQRSVPLYYPPFPALDGENTVSWQDLGLKGPVAITYYWFYPKTKTMLEFDIVFNNDLDWSTVRPVPVDPDGNPTHYDVASVATHEVGHTLVLFDLYAPKDYWLTMYGRTWKGDNLKDTLGYGDKLGIWKLYP